MKAEKNGLVTFTLSKENMYSPDRYVFDIGDTIKAGWIEPQIEKNKRTVFRMTKKVYFPHVKIKEIKQGENSKTLTVGNFSYSQAK